jgi:hypothetical protein
MSHLISYKILPLDLGSTLIQEELKNLNLTNSAKSSFRNKMEFTGSGQTCL